MIGDRNVFREFCTINRGATPDHGLTRIGDDNLFMAYTHVAHDCTLGNNIVMVNYAGLAGHVELGDWVILSGYTGVHQFCKIGAHAFTAALSGVTRDVPPYIMAVGQPAVPHSINSEGLKRRGFTPEQIRNLRTRLPHSLSQRPAVVGRGAAIGRTGSRRNPNSSRCSTSSPSRNAA